MEPCRHCKTSAETNFYATYQNGTARDHYVRCDGCGIVGPKSSTAEMAMHGWDDMIKGGSHE